MDRGLGGFGKGSCPKKGEGKIPKARIFEATASQEGEEGHKGDDVAIVEGEEELLERDNLDSESLTMDSSAQQSGSRRFLLLYGALLFLAAAAFLLIRRKRGSSSR